MIFQVKKNIRKFIIPISLAGLVVGGVVFLSTKSNITKVQVTKAEVRSISKTLSASGYTGVSNGFTQRAQISGNIKSVKFYSGDEVKATDIVVEFDQASLRASLDNAYSTYLGAKSDLESYDQRISAAKATEDVRKRERDEVWREYMADNGEDNKQAYKNAEALYQSAVSSLVTLENDKKAVENTVKSSYANYTSAYSSYANSVVKAPADGRLALAANITQGAYITSGQELFAITSPSNLVFKAEIDEADISQVAPGMKAKVSLDSYPGEYFDATIQTVDAKVTLLSNGSTAVMADVAFDTTKTLPILGLGGSVDIEIEKSEETLAVTPDTLIEETAKSYVYVVKANIIQKKEVETGFEGDEYIGIVSGLDEGDTIVIDPGSYNLTDGAKVTL